MNNQVSRIGKHGLIPPIEKAGGKVRESRESFSETLKKFMSDVNSMQNKASEAKEKLVTGEITDVHEVMIAVEEANTSMELMLEMRNKIVEAYQEIMRMPCFAYCLHRS